MFCWKSVEQFLKIKIVGIKTEFQQHVYLTGVMIKS